MSDADYGRTQQVLARLRAALELAQSRITADATSYALAYGVLESCVEETITLLEAGES